MRSKLLDLIFSDLNRYYQLDGRKGRLSLNEKLGILFFAYGFHAMAVYRFGQALKAFNPPRMLHSCKRILSFFYFLLDRIIRKIYGINIDKRAVIGKGFYIGHFGGIFVGACTIGENCSINQQVSIGNLNVKSQESDIKLGKNVWIGAHCKIESNVTIEDHGTIAAGSVVKEGTRIKQGYLYMGNPARAISANYDNSFLL